MVEKFEVFCLPLGLHLLIAHEVDRVEQLVAPHREVESKAFIRSWFDIALCLVIDKRVEAALQETDLDNFVTVLSHDGHERLSCGVFG